MVFSNTKVVLVSMATVASAVGVNSGNAQIYRETTISYGPDGLPNVRTQINPLGADPETLFEWDNVGNLVTVTGAEGGTATAGYDDNRRVVWISGNPSNANQRSFAQYTYDASGRILTTEVSEDGTSAGIMRATSISYTDAGQPVTISDPADDTTSFTYNQSGWLSTSTDPAGRTSRNTYHPDGLVAFSYEAWNSDDQATVVHRSYNALSQLETLTQGKGIGHAWNMALGASESDDFDTVWRFDPFGRVAEVEYPSADGSGTGDSDSFVSTPNGNLETHTTRSGDVITNLYDASNRIVSHTAPVFAGGTALDGPTSTTTTEYFVQGEPERVISADQHGAGNWELSYTYDYAGRITSETQISPPVAPSTTFTTRTVSYQYDLNGNRTRITWPDGYFVQYVYNDAGQLTNIKSNGTDLLAWYSYDNMGRMDAHVVSTVQGQTVGSVFPTYEDDSDLDALDYRFTNDINVVFDYGYDGSGLVTSQNVNQASWEWSPATSNVTLVSDTYTANNLDQYSDVSGTAPTYDDNGNLTTYGARNYIYSAENQLLEATTLGGGTVEYSYGPGARRVRKNVDGTVTSFIHAGGMEIAEYDNDGDLLRRYIPGPGVDQRIAMIECDETDPNSACAANDPGTDTQYYFADRLGNVLAVTDNTGDIVQQFFYTPFGVEMVGDEGGNPFRYTGRKYDPETGLYYYRARYYDADLGRFLQVDPIGYEDQWNLYTYVGNNPINGTDPSGTQEAPLSGTVAEREARIAQILALPEISVQEITIIITVAEESGGGFVRPSSSSELSGIGGALSVVETLAEMNELGSGKLLGTLGTATTIADGVYRSMAAIEAGANEWQVIAVEGGRTTLILGGVAGGGAIGTGAVVLLTGCTLASGGLCAVGLAAGIAVGGYLGGSAVDANTQTQYRIEYTPAEYAEVYMYLAGDGLLFHSYQDAQAHNADMIENNTRPADIEVERLRGEIERLESNE